MRLARWSRQHRKPGAYLSLSCSVRSYISAEGISIRNAKEFLVRQTRSMRKRHTALKAARQRWHQDMQEAQEVVQDRDSSQLLEGVRKNLEEVSHWGLAGIHPSAKYEFAAVALQWFNYCMKRDSRVLVSSADIPTKDREKIISFADRALLPAAYSCKAVEPAGCSVRK